MNIFLIEYVECLDGEAGSRPGGVRFSPCVTSAFVLPSPPFTLASFINSTLCILPPSLGGFHSAGRISADGQHYL
jgi:hypothetical protein